MKVPAGIGIIYTYNYFLRRQVVSIMMEKLRNPKNVKTISLIVAAIFVIGCFTLAMSAGGFGSSVREFDNNSQNMNEEEKERYYRQMQERLANKEKDLMDPVLKGINDTIKKVAEKKGLKVVVDKSTVVYGGTDITDEVAKALQNPKK